jgi:hypothetical protein
LRTGIEATSVAQPFILKDADGGLVISATVNNNNDKLQPFVALIEVRDSSGVTVFLALSGGTLEPLRSSNVDIGWQPEHDGTFEVRTFIISSIDEEAEILSLPAVSSITINSQTT